MSGTLLRSNTTTFGFASSASGITTKFYIGQAYVDFCQYGVWIEANGTEGQIAN